MNNAFLLPDTFEAKVDNFTTLLLKYNQIHNITGAKTREAVSKNVEDSIYPLRFLPSEDFKEAIDVGSGAGFPGLLLALALPHVHVTLFEPIAKKSAFLHLAKTTLDIPNMDISTNRVEKIAPWSVDLIASRAVTNTKMLIALCKGFISPSSTLLFYKGEMVEEEIKGLEGGKIYQNGKRHYLVLKNLKDTHVA